MIFNDYVYGGIYIWGESQFCNYFDTLNEDKQLMNHLFDAIYAMVNSG